MAAILDLIDIYDTKTKTFTQLLGLNKGEDYRRTIYLYTDALHQVPMDLTGATAEAQLKVFATDSTPVATFQCLFSVDRTDGKIVLYIPKAILSAIVTKGKSYSEKTALVWDMEVTPLNGDTIRIFNGKAELSPEVTT